MAESAKPRQLTSIPHSRANSWLELMTGSRSRAPPPIPTSMPLAFRTVVTKRALRVPPLPRFENSQVSFEMYDFLPPLSPFLSLFFLSFPREKPRGGKVSLDNFYFSLPLRYWTRYIYIYIIIMIIKYAIRGSVSIRMDGCTPFSELKFSFAVPGKQAAKQTLISHPLKYRVFICL